MSGAKHTPGPWIVKDLGPQQGKWVYAEAAPNGWHDDGSYLSLCVSSIGDANARLIAAAPELLEALCHAVDYLNGNGWEGDERMKPLEAAIAKARGQA